MPARGYEFYLRVFNSSVQQMLSWTPEDKIRIQRACNILFIINYLITESEVVTGKSQTEALPYWPGDSEVNTVGRGLRFSRNDRTVEVINNGNWTEWSAIWSEITSMISDQNCTPLSSIATLLDPFWNRTILSP